MRACSPLFHRDTRADEEGTLDTGTRDTGTRGAGRRVAEAGCAREVVQAVDGVHSVLAVGAVFPCDWRRALEEEEEEEEEVVQVTQVVEECKSLKWYSSG